MNQRKLLLNHRVEVRQFEEGLRGSWHPGVIVGVSEQCRSVEYDELLSETGDSKLIESIPVTKAIEGLHRRRHVPPNYRGRIRPPPPAYDPCGKLSFGVCVDVLFEDAWWEGVIFDGNDGADKRVVFFPDEADERKFSVSKLRVTRDWDEFLGMWCDRGVWVLVQLAQELKLDVPLSNYVKKVWASLQSNYGFNKMISEWTCCVPTMWNKFFMDVVNEITVDSSQQELCNDKIQAHTVRRKGNKTKEMKCDRLTYKFSDIPLQAEKCGTLNIAILKKRGKKKGCVECKQNKRALKSKLESKKHSVIDISDKNKFRADKLGCEEKMLDGDSCVTINDNEGGGIHQISRDSTHMDEVEKSVSLPTQNKKCGKVKYGINKPKSNKNLAVCLVQEKHIARVRQNDLSARVRQNLAMSRRITRAFAVSTCIRKLQERQDSLVTGSKQKKRSVMGKRILKQYQPPKSKLEPVSKVKEKKWDAKQNKYSLSTTQCCRTRSSGNYVMDVSRQDMVSRPRKRKRKRGCQGFQLSDTVCSFCHYEGDLILCGNCPSSYHMSCLDLKDAPNGKWFCPACCCGLCGLRGDSEQFTNPCLQCGREYHVYCLNKSGHLITDYPSEKFCSKACYKLCAQLHELLGTSNKTSVEGLTWTLTRSAKKVYNFPGLQRISTPIKLCHVLRVMHECFIPVKEPHTKRDVVKDVVYNSGSKLKRLDFRGFYDLILHKGDEIVSVATVRIHGLKAAEMPLVATPFQYRQQGMCRLLVNELSKLLTKLGVERFFLPSIPQLKPTWETSFGFLEMHHSERLQFSGYPFLSFQGTVMLQKFLSRSRTITKETHDFGKKSRVSEKNSASAPLDHICTPNNKTKFCGLFYKRNAKRKIIGKENVDDCTGNVNTYIRVYKRRRILTHRFK